MSANLLSTLSIGRQVIPTYTSTRVVSTFNSSGTFVAPTGVYQVSAILVGGGGRGGNGTVYGAGGGGGGGAVIVVGPLPTVPTRSYTVTIGAGGAQGATDDGRGIATTLSGANNYIQAPGGGGGQYWSAATNTRKSLLDTIYGTTGSFAGGGGAATKNGYQFNTYLGDFGNGPAGSFQPRTGIDGFSRTYSPQAPYGYCGGPNNINSAGGGGGVTNPGGTPNSRFPGQYANSAWQQQGFGGPGVIYNFPSWTNLSPLTAGGGGGGGNTYLDRSAFLGYGWPISGTVVCGGHGGYVDGIASVWYPTNASAGAANTGGGGGGGGYNENYGYTGTRYSDGAAGGSGVAYIIADNIYTPPGRLSSQYTAIRFHGYARAGGWIASVQSTTEPAVMWYGQYMNGDIAALGLLGRPNQNSPIY